MLPFSMSRDRPDVRRSATSFVKYLHPHLEANYHDAYTRGFLVFSDAAYSMALIGPGPFPIFTLELTPCTY